MWCIELGKDHLSPRLFRHVDAEQIRVGAIWLGSVAVFTCFALRNANPGGCMEPRWLQGLSALALEVSQQAGADDQDWTHLDQDWEASQERWRRITAQMRANEELERALDEHLASWRRASRDVDNHYADPEEPTHYP